MRGLSDTLRSMPTSAWLVGGAGVLLAALALSLTAWSKALVKDTLRYGCTEFGARQQILTRDWLEDLASDARKGEVLPEVRSVWTYEGGEVVTRLPTDAPDPPAAFGAVVSKRTAAHALSAGPRAVSWRPRNGRNVRELVERGPTGSLVEWDLSTVTASLEERFRQESLGRYELALFTPSRPRPNSYYTVAELALPEPITTWKVAVRLRNLQAERTAVRLQTAALVALVVWLLGLLGFGLWRGARREREERARRIQREQLLVRATHELQTPLALLRAACESIDNGAVEGEDRDRALQIVVREEARLTSAIRRLLRHLRLQQAGPELAPITDVVRATAEEERPAIDAHGLTLELQIDPKAEDLFAPEAFVADLVRELCANARKHARGARGLKLALVARGTIAHLVYRDDGPGFGAPTQHPRGLGVLLLEDGLAALGGRLKVGAPLEGGAQVEVSLPCQRTPTPS